MTLKTDGITSDCSNKGVKPVCWNFFQFKLSLNKNSRKPFLTLYVVEQNSGDL